MPGCGPVNPCRRVCDEQREWPSWIPAGWRKGEKFNQQGREFARGHCLISSSTSILPAEVHYIIACKMLAVAVAFFGADELLEDAANHVGRHFAEVDCFEVAQQTAPGMQRSGRLKA